MSRPFPFALGVSVAIDRVALSGECGPVWSALSRRTLDLLIVACLEWSDVLVARSSLNLNLFSLFLDSVAQGYYCGSP